MIDKKEFEDSLRRVIQSGRVRIECLGCDAWLANYGDGSDGDLVGVCPRCGKVSEEVRFRANEQ